MRREQEDRIFTTERTMETIGFFGDSFCELLNNKHSIDNNYRTYMELCVDELHLKIVNTGMGGSSLYDMVLKQLNPLIKSNSIPDVCVFFYTIPQRLYHPVCRSIHMSNALNGYNSKKEEWFSKTYPNEKNWFSKDIWDAAQQYFMHLYDEEKSQLEYLSFLQYIDNNILSQLKNTKIINLWSIGNVKNWDLDSFKPENINYVHDWKHGVEVRPALMSLSAVNGNTFKYPMIDDRPNHLDGQLKNDMVFDYIVKALENYDEGVLLDYTDGVNKLWNE